MRLSVGFGLRSVDVEASPTAGLANGRQYRDGALVKDTKYATANDKFCVQTLFLKL